MRGRSDCWPLYHPLRRASVSLIIYALRARRAWATTAQRHDSICKAPIERAGLGSTARTGLSPLNHSCTHAHPCASTGTSESASTNPGARARTHTHPLAPACTHTHSHARTRGHMHNRTHACSHAHSRTNTFTHARTLSLFHSVTQSLTHALTHPLTQPR